MKDANFFTVTGKVRLDAEAVKTATGKTLATFDLVHGYEMPDGTVREVVLKMDVGPVLAPEAISKAKQYERLTCFGKLTANAGGLVLVVTSFEVGR